MYMISLTLHVVAVMLVIGTLFVQSLTVVFRLRLSDQSQIEGVQWVQRRVHQLIYHPDSGYSNIFRSLPGDDSGAVHRSG